MRLRTNSGPGQLYAADIQHAAERLRIRVAYVLRRSVFVFAGGSRLRGDERVPGIYGFSGHRHICRCDVCVFCHAGSDEKRQCGFGGRGAVCFFFLISTDLFHRGALGEATAFVFLPVAFLGYYHIMYGERRPLVPFDHRHAGAAGFPYTYERDDGAGADGNDGVFRPADHEKNRRDWDFLL